MFNASSSILHNAPSKEETQQALPLKDATSALRDEYEAEVARPHMQVLAEAVIQYRDTDPDALWTFVFKAGKGVVLETDTCDPLTWVQFTNHLARVNAFWDKAVSKHEAGDILPDFFKPSGGWLARAENYRKLLEPMYIALYYRMDQTPYLQLDTKGEPYKRPKRYWYIEEQWRKLNPAEEKCNTTVWAEEYEAQKKAGVPHRMTMWGTRVSSE